MTRKTARWYVPALLGVACAIVLGAPWIGLGERYDFVLYRWLGLERGSTFHALLSFIFVFLTVELLAVGVHIPSGRSRWLAIGDAAWRDGCAIAREMLSSASAPRVHADLRALATLLACLCVIFAILFPKISGWFRLQLDQHWWQAMLDYETAWRTPVFPLGANLLNNFGIQLPLKPQLLPFEGAASWFSIEHRIAATVVFCFAGLIALFTWIGALIGFRPVYRLFFAGITALILTIPSGLDRLLPILPPHFVTHQFILALWWGEAPILLLATVVLFFLVGRRERPLRNLAAGLGFAAGAFAVVLAYPVGAVYFVPLMLLYCAALLLTSERKAEFVWKIATCAAVGVAMLALRVPQFFLNLYLYTFGTYFPTDGNPLTSNSLVASHFQDSRGLFFFLIAFLAIIVAARHGTIALRRLAIATLVCELGIVALGLINHFFWQLPLFGAYAELGHAPMWASFYVLALLIAALLLDRRLAELCQSARGKLAGILHNAVLWRHWAYAALFSLALATYAVLQTPVTDRSDYPPGQPPSVQLLERELALSPGAPFRGRLMTLVPAELQGPSDQFKFNDVVATRYRQDLGNDHYIDVLPFNVPVLNEYGHWTSPLSFAYFRIFFGKERENFGKAWYVLSRFDLKMARLMGVRIVATDAASMPGGTLIHETKATDIPLRLFRLDDVNVGQYSPTRAHLTDTASEAIATLKTPTFDPKSDVVVEDEIPGPLVPATSATVAADLGAKLVVHAKSPGRSLLVLPFEFSHCLRLTATSGAAQLLPANLQQIGLLFESEVTADIVYRFGLSGDTACRGEDLKRIDRLRLRQALIDNNRAPVR